MSVAVAPKPLPEKKPVKVSNQLLGAGLNMFEVRSGIARAISSISIAVVMRWSLASGDELC